MAGTVRCATVRRRVASGMDATTSAPTPSATNSRRDGPEWLRESVLAIGRLHEVQGPRITGALARVAAAGAVPAAAARLVPLEPAEQHEDGDHGRDTDQLLDHVALNRPAKPMNASESEPARIMMRPMLRAALGTSASSSDSRICAISTSASIRPSPPPM